MTPPATPLPDEGKLLLARKVNLAPDAWASLPAPRRVALDHPWGLAMGLARLLGKLPAHSLRFLAGEPLGQLVIHAGPSRYAPDPQAAGHVAYIDVAALPDGDPELWRALAGLLDHLLGCHGQPDGPWLSEGGGIGPAWQGVGKRIQRLFPLGYGLDETARSAPRGYLASSLAWQMCAPQRLETADPLMARLLRATLLDERFWARAAQDA
ncbi:MAG: hypothetical protein GX605_10795 [Chloroflexi bacterium]|nr:hypothetical protein [Chloroflexota bacterium]